AAGGIHDRYDIKKNLEMGCLAVQMGTRFLATYESGASLEYKKKLVECNEDDIVLADNPGSPCGLLFRVLKQSPFYQEALNQERTPNCNKGYVLIDGKCKAKDGLGSFCICNGLLSSSGHEDNEKPLYSVGARAWEINEITSVESLMQELTAPVCL